jgi:hypothetical protein
VGTSNLSDLKYDSSNIEKGGDFAFLPQSLGRGDDIIRNTKGDCLSPGAGPLPF